MTLLSALVLAALVVLFALAVRYLHRHGTCAFCGDAGCRHAKKTASHSGCSGNCTACCSCNADAKHKR